MTPQASPRVVVGVDPSEHAAVAVDWAADEAAVRGWPLEIVHARGAGASRLVEFGSRHAWEELDRAAKHLAADTERRALDRQGRLEVRTALVDDAPLPGLIELVTPDDLLVVGSRGHGRLSSLMIGSVSQGLAAHAPCPVVVVPDRGAGLPTAPVVLGAAPAEPSAVVEFAFAEAGRRGVPLLAVRAWSLVEAYPGLATASVEDRTTRDRTEVADLATLLAAAREKHPEVTVQAQVNEDAPESPFIRDSENAGLVVLGAQRTRGRLAPPLGRVIQRVLHEALCPVALVPHD
ncbi:universal stress protein [Streptacidiphilus pinicola]|uniref:Universal stress protein n=1 Tax=Streptacidiphilus pinicola TaxID=2219663 RepID=A0A2X0KIE7_9ACTN|nr:universal stress protein [Streptacidiphilus pinicola]RAG86809.1 universal stress protein [Streptacidiphilus pinicola]